jgi:hypothetical protein
MKPNSISPDDANLPDEHGTFKPVILQNPSNEQLANLIEKYRTMGGILHSETKDITTGIITLKFSENRPAWPQPE